MTPTSASAPVGVFDSGVGGLSVLRHIHALLPKEQLLYFADAGHAPYGEKTDAEVAARALAVAAFMLTHQVKAMVVACNTATAAAIEAIRIRYPALLVVGVEPGLKPAAAVTLTQKVGVLATQGTLASERFKSLREQIAGSTGVEFLMMPCPGLADQIEKGELRSAASAALAERFVAPLINAGVDTLVLGCTHYPFVLPLIESSARRAQQRSGRGAKPIQIIDTGEAVARQLQRLLNQGRLMRTESEVGSVTAFTTGSSSMLGNSFKRLLQLTPDVAAISGD